MNKLSIKFLTTTMVLISFVIVSISGILLLFNLDKSLHELVKQIHIVFAFFLIFVVIIHFSLNYSLYIAEAKNYFKDK